MPVVRAYSLLHREPPSPGIMLSRYLGNQRSISVDESLKETMILNNETHETQSLTTNEFLADMKLDYSEIDSMYEACGALIDEGFVLQDEDEDFEEMEELDGALPIHDSPPMTPQMFPRDCPSDKELVPPTPPYLLSRGRLTIPELFRPSHLSLNGAPGYIHLDPTRPNPNVQYLCEWNGTCIKRLRGSSPGYIQRHLRQDHLIRDHTDDLVRCMYVAHGENRICGIEMPAKEIGIHVCDVHWKSRTVRCPFCGHWQVCRDNDIMRAHWADCVEYKSASEETRKIWVQSWKWPAKRWSSSNYQTISDVN